MDSRLQEERVAASYPQRVIGGGPFEQCADTFGEHGDVEPMLARSIVDAFFVGREQVHQQRPELRLLHRPGDELIAVAMAAAAAAVGKDDDAAGIDRDNEVTV